MREIEPGLYRVNSEDEMQAFEAQKEQIKGAIIKLAGEQRARLNAGRPEYQWWADAVFGLRDIRSVCTMLNLNGEEDTAEMLAEIIGKVGGSFLTLVANGDQAKVEELRLEMMKEGELLDGVMSQAMAKLQGVKEQ